jgi:HD superfamily phosphohydrolase
LSGEIRDPVHGDIFLDDVELAIIDTPQFQRLRWLSELPTAQFVYPGATHSRFSHCIGVLELATRIFQNLKSLTKKPFRGDPEDRRNLRIAALLHDIEAPPYYPVFQEHFLVKDELKSLRRESVTAICKDVSEQYNEFIDAEIILNIINNESESRYLSQIIDCEVGANRLDYLMRDATYCGVNYGKIDPRILYEFYYDNRELVLLKEALPLVDAVFNSLFQMKINVYDHKISKLTTRMVYDIIEGGLKKHACILTNLLRMNDHELFQELRKIDNETTSLLENRILPKTASTLNAVSLRDPDIPKYFESFKRKDSIENEIRQETTANSVFVEFSTLRHPPSTPIEAQVNSRRVRLDEVPLLRRWYDKEPYRQWKMFIFCQPHEREKVREECEKFFGPLEIGRESEPRRVIPSLKELYARLDEEAEGQTARSSIRSKIMELPRHELLTLRALAEIGPSTAEEVCKTTKRERSTESLLLNRLAESGFAEKQRQGKRIYFKPLSPVIIALKEL